MMIIKNELKSIVAKEGLTLTKAIEKMNTQYNRKETIQNFSNKLQKNTIKFTEIDQLLDSLGYEITITKK